MNPNVFSANLKIIYSHNFSVGEFIIKKSKDGNISHLIVDEVVSSEKIKTRTLLRNGNVDNNAIFFEGKELENLVSNYPANIIKNR